LSLFASTAALSPSSLKERYSQAREIRCEKGHEAASSLYEALLREKPADLTTATRIGASSEAWRALQDFGLKDTDESCILEVGSFLAANGFCTQAIHKMLDVPQDQRHASAPLYITPAAAGTVAEAPYTKENVLSWLVALFLLGVAVPCDWIPTCFLQAGLVCPLDGKAVAVVSIMPVENLGYVVTDWHPRVLSTVAITKQDEAVMYVGPDSLALVQHFWNQQQSRQSSVLDLCSGSGIQALAALQHCDLVVSVDTNPRALRMCLFNAKLNRIDKKRWLLIQGNLLVGSGSYYSPHQARTEESSDLLTLVSNCCNGNGFDTISANPPFLPVPSSIQKSRHGLFSSGGSSGEDVLLASLDMAAKVLKQSTGQIGFVSEFFWGETIDTLLERLHRAFDRNCLVLFTNEYPLDAPTYATRRANSEEEFHLWNEHLNGEGMINASPGILLGSRTVGNAKHVGIKRSSSGSLWTPSNIDAIKQTKSSHEQLSKYQKKQMQQLTNDA